MPGVTVCCAAVNFNRNPAKQVLNPCVKGMQQCRQGGELDGTGLLRLTFLQERTVELQKMLQLCLLDTDLLFQLRPHVAEVPCCADVR